METSVIPEKKRRKKKHKTFTFNLSPVIFPLCPLPSLFTELPQFLSISPYQKIEG